MKALKATLIFVMCFVLLAASTVLPASALENGADATVYMDGTGVKVGETFTVTVYLENITTPDGALGCDIPVKYDPEHLELVDRVAICPAAWDYNILSLCTKVIKPEENPYWLRCVYNGTDLIINKDRNIKEDKAIGFTLKFKAKSVGRSYVETVSGDGTNFAYIVNSDNKLTNYGLVGHRVNFAISEKGNKLGDINGNGYVDSFDASIALRADIKLVTLTDNEKALGDTNGDGKVSTIDASQILRYDVGLINGF